MERIAFLFTGQGAQFTGMGKPFYDKYNVAKQTFNEASDVLGIDMAKLCFEGSLMELSKTENTQPALLTVGVTAYRAYMQDVGVAPEFCAGHSFGEYAALVCSGAMKFSDALKVVHKRGLLCKEVADSGIGAMTIVEGAEQKTVEEICHTVSNDEQQVAINTYNSPAQFSIAGHREAVEKAEDCLLEKGANITPLLFSAPFHNILMEAVTEDIYNELSKCSFKKLMWPVLSNVTAQPYSNEKQIADLLTKQLAKPVQWQATMEYLVKNGVTKAVEMGSKNVLAALVKSNTYGVIEGFCYGQAEHRDKLQNTLLKDKQRIENKTTVVAACLAAAVATPNLNYDRIEYNEGVIKPYKEILKIQESLKIKNELPSEHQMQQAIDLLTVIFKTKKVAAEEQAEWFRNITERAGVYYLELAQRIGVF